MLDIIATIIIGLVFAYFATQNITAVPVKLGFLSLSSVPLYLVVLASLLLGVVISFIIHLIDAVGAMMTIMGKNTEIKNKTKEVVALEQRIHDLELENARLNGDTAVPHLHHETAKI